MIYFEHLPLDKEILKALGELSINYVFQPIFLRDGKTVYAREALMRPLDQTVTELIREYISLEKLHVLEVATFFGAMQEYQMRGYSEYVSLNSFPCEFFNPSESRAFVEYFGDLSGRGIIEILEYPAFSSAAFKMKKSATGAQRLRIAIDDFGVGLNDMEMVDRYQPEIVKIARALISGIDTDIRKQNNVLRLFKEFHRRGMMVVAEGIERREEFEFLSGIGIDLFQGYYLARPN